MKIPVLQGIIKRRVLLNYRAAPEVIRKILPSGFRPKLHRGRAVAGICLIRLEQIRPQFAPGFVGVSSENAAHRIAVEWTDESGQIKEGVFIPRRDTDSLINQLAGGRLFSSEHHKAEFDIEEDEDEINFRMRSADSQTEVSFKGKRSEDFPVDSIFSDLREASLFFEKGSLGYSPDKTGKKLDAISLEINDWRVRSFETEFVRSSFYQNETIFPAGSIEFDHALLMQNIAHRWLGERGRETDQEDLRKKGRRDPI